MRSTAELPRQLLRPQEQGSREALSTGGCGHRLAQRALPGGRARTAWQLVKLKVRTSRSSSARGSGPGRPAGTRRSPCGRTSMGALVQQVCDNLPFPAVAEDSLRRMMQLALLETPQTAATPA
mmetsp:Transcript_617/g.1206  ORF Transcript_617/g.1206 Transcript_617/m.1206 type:complete len:123 (+) Transcript_617:766-1134(+)